jgi:hypothetical protein
MSVTRLPSGRWRAQVYDAGTGKNVSVSAVLGGQARSRLRAMPSEPASEHANVLAASVRAR